MAQMLWLTHQSSSVSTVITALAPEAGRHWYAWLTVGGPASSMSPCHHTTLYLCTSHALRPSACAPAPPWNSQLARSAISKLDHCTSGTLQFPCTRNPRHNMWRAEQCTRLRQSNMAYPCQATSATPPLPEFLWELAGPPN